MNNESTSKASLSAEQVRMVAPALDKYTHEIVLGDLWKRPGLAPRDRSIVTLAVLITRNQMIDMPLYLGLALDSGVKPREISETIVHLAFYSGWENAISAVAAGAQTMKIRIKVNGASMTGTLEDNATSRDFMSLLPLTLTLEDYNGTEKIGYLPKKLSTKDAPAGIDPSIGDITYYAPWGNLAIFYRDFGYSRGLIKLGRIDPGIEALTVPAPLQVTIEPFEK